MSSFLCFICHSTVNKETNEETRDKYREVVGINLCPDSQLCYICCHVLNKLSLFRSICLKRSLEYPVLFREKGTLNLQKSDLEIHVLCPDDCNQYQRSKFYQYSYSNDINDSNYNNDNEYVKLEYENVFHEYLNQCQYQNVESNDEKDENSYHCSREIDESDDINTDDVANDDDAGSNEEDDENVNENANVNVNIDLEQNYKKECYESENNLFNIENDNDDNETQKQDDDKNKVLEDVNENEDEKSRSKDGSKKKKGKKSKKKGFKKTILSLEEQKAELEANRKGKKYIEAEFKCYNCALGFLFKDTYQAHMMRHEESNGEHQCATCTLRFASPALLRAHAAAHAERHACPACGAALRPRAARAHRCPARGDAGAGSVACHVCGNLFRDAAGLQQHIRRVHTSKASGRLHPCSVCGDSFNTHASLRTHMIKHIKRKFPCSFCSASYSSPYTRAQHERSHAHAQAARPTLACACGALYSSRKSLLAHQRSHASHQHAVFECASCGRACRSARALAAHAAAHGAAAQPCPACPARLRSRKALLRHLRGHAARPAAPRAVCYLCGNCFKGNNKLNRHLREVCEKAKLQEQAAEVYE